jgi:signal transduction histidine kinase
MSELRLEATAPGDGPLARLVHDLRTPLQVIRGECFTLSRGAATRRERAGLRAIDAEAVRVSAALEALLRLSVATPPPRARLDLAALALDAAHRAAVAAQPRGVGVRPRRRGAAAPMVVARPEPLRRALDNLLANAVRHSPRGGRVTVDVRVAGDEARVVVRDEGPGITHEDRERIFAPGVRGTGARGPGAGLGLAIARDAVHADGGRLVVVPSRSGAAFLLGLPRVRP